MNILFIGNSFTYYNCLTGIFRELCVLNGRDVNVEEITVGGYYLHQYLNKADKHGLAVPYKLRQRPWDIVVLQDQSANPALDPEDFLRSASLLSRFAWDAGARPCFYQTWSYREGSEKLSSIGLDYDTLYELLRSSYERAAAENEALLAPVGTAFREMIRKHPEIDLYNKEDNYHPSPGGTCLAALTFYKTLFGEKPEKLYIPEELTEETCRILCGDM